MRSRDVVLGLLLASVVLSACSREEPVVEWSDPASHAERFVSVNGARLHVLDWGGSGDAIVLVPGGGDNPHAFDALAPRLTDSYRVVSYARRAHGRSQAIGPYDMDTLVSDLAAIMDTLGMRRAHLAGWSMGGHEITRFAALHPDRVGKLVYLDGAYEWTNPIFGEHMKALTTLEWEPPPPALADFTAFKAWLQRGWFEGTPWTATAEAYARDLVEETPDGRLRFLPAGSVLAPLTEAIASYRRDYRSVQAPALAIFVPEFAPVDVSDPEVRRQRAEWTAAHWQSWQQLSLKRFESEMRSRQVILLPTGNHLTFPFVHHDTIASAMRAFLTAK